MRSNADKASNVTTQDTEGEDKITMQGEKDRAKSDTIITTGSQEFLVHNIMLHGGQKHARKYTARWYG